MPDSLAEALAALQADLPHIGKTSEGQAGTRKILYADLEKVADALYPRLANYGLLWRTKPTLKMFGTECKFVLAYRIEHVASGEYDTGDYPITPGNPQQMGSAITYARRYALVAVTGVVPAGDDDDGHIASRADGLPQNKDGTLSRSRTTDAEKTAAGVMTDAQAKEHSALAKGADRGRVPGTVRVPTTPGDDPWYAAPPEGRLVIEVDHDSPGTITHDQQKAMHAAFGQLGIKDRAKRLEMTEKLLRFMPGGLTSSSALSHSEAGRLLSALAEYARTGGVAGLEAEAARRAG
ncbi:MAG TPA: ERF family protein [Streptosporangiaceae bacterium]|nr:ERF family protein [Streptosporangiaceae bacterium]